MEQDRIICQKCGHHNSLFRTHCINCAEELEQQKGHISYSTLPSYKRANREDKHHPTINETSSAGANTINEQGPFGGRNSRIGYQRDLTNTSFERGYISEKESSVASYSTPVNPFRNSSPYQRREEAAKEELEEAPVEIVELPARKNRVYASDGASSDKPIAEITTIQPKVLSSLAYSIPDTLISEAPIKQDPPNLETVRPVNNESLPLFEAKSPSKLIDGMIPLQPEGTLQPRANTRKREEATIPQVVGKRGGDRHIKFEAKPVQPPVTVAGGVPLENGMVPLSFDIETNNQKNIEFAETPDLEATQKNISFAKTPEVNVMQDLNTAQKNIEFAETPDLEATQKNIFAETSDLEATRKNVFDETPDLNFTQKNITIAKTPDLDFTQKNIAFVDTLDIDAVQNSISTVNDNSSLELLDATMPMRIITNETVEQSIFVNDNSGLQIEEIEKTAVSGFALVSVVGFYSYYIPISAKERIIGRAYEAKEFLKDKPFVSRRHARIHIIDGKAYIEDINETNHTFVNNAAVKKGYMAELTEGDEIGLGGKLIDGERQSEAAFFIFKVV